MAQNPIDEKQRAAGDQMHIEIVPGTEIMKDVGDVHFVHSHGKTKSPVLIPQPSNNPRDPLNWSRWWKFLAIFNQGFFVLVSVLTPLSIAPMTPIFMKEWGKSESKIAILTGATVLALGYANFIIIPFSNAFGRRSASIACGAICIAANVWQALATSYGSFLGARILCGLGAAAHESIMTVVITDVFFLHERGTWVGLYFWCFFMGLFLGPIISGNVSEAIGWRWFFWICTIAQVLSFILLIVSFPETKYKRFSAPGKDVSDSDVNEKPGVEDVEVNTNSAIVGHGNPSIKQFRLISKPDPAVVRLLVTDLFIPIKIFFFPIILWASASMAFAACVLLAVNLTQSQSFSAPPYNFTPRQVGLVNFALIGGGMFGLLTAGPLSDWVSSRATKKNGGVREPEMRLPAIALHVVGCLIGTLVVGYGYQYRWAWEAVVIVGFGIVGLEVVSIPTIAITYAVDCYRPVSGQIMVTATVFKNTFAFGTTYFINDWAARSGFIGPIMLIGGLTVGTTAVGAFVFYFWGKTFRRWTKNSSLHVMEW